MEDNNTENYEELSVGSGDAPNPNSFIAKKNFKTPIKKRKISFVLLLLIIIGLGLFFIIKSSYVSSLSEQNEELQKEINSFTKNEENLKIQNYKLISKKESLLKDNNSINEQINKIKEKNMEIEINNNKMTKGLSERKSIIKDYELKIENLKNELINLINKENNMRIKINSCNKQIKALETKIDELENNITNIDYKDLKERKKEEKKFIKNNEINLDEINLNVKSRINSKIIFEPKYLYLLDRWFEKELKYELLYRASEEGYSPRIFHNKVDNIKNTLLLIKDINNFIYGGFTRKTWDGNKIYKNDKNAIVFNLEKEIYYKIKNEKYAIFCDPDNLAIFGEGDIYLGEEGVKSFFPKNYGDISENKEYELTLGYKKLIPLEIEVFKLS